MNFGLASDFPPSKPSPPRCQINFQPRQSKRRLSCSQANLVGCRLPSRSMVRASGARHFRDFGVCIGAGHAVWASRIQIIIPSHSQMHHLAKRALVLNAQDNKPPNFRPSPMSRTNGISDSSWSQYQAHGQLRFPLACLPPGKGFY